MPRPAKVSLDRLHGEPQERYCNLCGETLPISRFYFRSSQEREEVLPKERGKGGRLAQRMSICLDCSKKLNTKQARLRRYAKTATADLWEELRDCGEQMAMIADEISKREGK